LQISGDVFRWGKDFRDYGGCIGAVRQNIIQVRTLDAANGDQISGGGAGSLAAVAGYPHLTVPMGLVKGLPVGLSFIGPKWSEQLLLNLGYAYEQARGPFPMPKFHRSIEESPEIAPLLQPHR